MSSHQDGKPSVLKCELNGRALAQAGANHKVAIAQRYGSRPANGLGVPSQRSNLVEGIPHHASLPIVGLVVLRFRVADCFPQHIELCLLFTGEERRVVGLSQFEMCCRCRPSTRTPDVVYARVFLLDIQLLLAYSTCWVTSRLVPPCRQRPRWRFCFFGSPFRLSPFICNTSISCTILVQNSACKLFRMNTCISKSKHMTLTIFRMNTYEKPGGTPTRKRRRVSGSIFKSSAPGPAF